MPYITQEDRMKWEFPLEELAETIGAFSSLKTAPTVGELNYLLSSILHHWLLCVGVKYANINGAIGVLECAKLELYRQLAAPYEDEKRKVNGGISPLDTITTENDGANK